METFQWAVWKLQEKEKVVAKEGQINEEDLYVDDDLYDGRPVSIRK